MIKFSRGDLGKGLVLGFGLSRANINQLVKGNPILAPLEELGPLFKNAGVYIFFGETEEKMKEDLQDLITEQTKVVDHKRGVEN